MNMDKQGHILIVDDNEDILFALNLLLKPHFEKIRVTSDPLRIEHFITAYAPDEILLDMNFEGTSANDGSEGFYWLQRIKALDPEAVVIFITAYADMEKAVLAIKAGAADFIPKPWEKEKLLTTLTQAVRLRQSQREVSRLQQRVADLEGGMPTIVGECESMKSLLRTVDAISPTDANVLILGENGTGKDLIAERIHAASVRSQKPFVRIDMGSIPEMLFESELFGHEKGAFTDAKKQKIGRWEAASGGTLFLDEIGNLSLSMQAKVLTAIEKHTITRVGGSRPLEMDVRLVCATNANLSELVRQGLFRQDLLYRINTIELQLPPLRERGEDVLLLADCFLRQYAQKYGKRMPMLSDAAKRKLMAHDWPGNVRELRHTIERALILNSSNTITLANWTPKSSMSSVTDDTLNLETLERQAIEQALAQARGNISRAAQLLGITRFALYRKMGKLNL